MSLAFRGADAPFSGGFAASRRRLSLGLWRNVPSVALLRARPACKCGALKGLLVPRAEASALA